MNKNWKKIAANMPFVGISVGILFLILTVPAMVGAQPTDTPPNGNVDANFNSVASQLLTVNNGSGTTGFKVDSTGGVSNPGSANSGYLTVKDNLAVTGNVTVAGPNDLWLNGNSWIRDNIDNEIYVAENLTSSGHFKAASIGSYYYRYSGVASHSSGSWASCDGTTSGGLTCILNASCDGSDTAIDISTSWMVNATAATSQLFDYLDTNHGSIYMNSSGNKPDNWQIRVKCFKINS